MCIWYHQWIICSFQAGSSLRTFLGHSSAVASLDFHPNKDDFICSCDGDGEIRYWSINNGSCSRVFRVKINMNCHANLVAPCGFNEMVHQVHLDSLKIV